MSIIQTLRSFLLAMIMTTAFSDLSHARDEMDPNAAESTHIITHTSLRLASLNIAHGRGDGVNQLLKKRNSFETNLNSAAELLNQLQANVVALQEADAASRWSGNFNHVARLASASDYPYYFHGSHATSFMYNYGTAILSRQALRNSYSHTFAPSPPTTNKGYVAGTLWWNPDDRLPHPLSVTIASIHLDFSRSKVRRAQIAEIIDNFSEVEGLLILMGDFNTDASKDDGVLQMLANRFDMLIYQPDAEDLGTFVSHGTRLDWILISSRLQFTNYQVLPEVVSDHYMITADVELVHSNCWRAREMRNDAGT